MQALGSLRGGRRGGRSWWIGFALVSLVCLWVAPQARAEATLLVYVNGSFVQALTANEVWEARDMSASNTLALRGDPESSNPGASLSAVAVLAGISPRNLAVETAVTVAERVPSPTSSVTLTRAEVLEGIPNPISPKTPPGHPVFFKYLPSQMLFYVPLRSANDPSPWGESLGSRDEGSLTVEFSTSSEVLKVDATCTGATVGEPVECTAEPVGSSGEGWTYSWDFGDESAEGSGKRTSHVYGEAGTFAAHLIVASSTGEGAKPVSVRVEAKKPAGGDGPEGEPPGPEEEPPHVGPTTDPQAETGGSGDAPPESVASGPDQSEATKNSKGHRPHRRKTHRSDAAEPGRGDRGDPGAGAGTADGLGGGDEPGAATGPRTASPDPGVDRFEESQSTSPATSPAESAAKPSPSEESRPPGPLVEGLVLSRTTGAGSPFDTSAAAPRLAEHQQQAAAGGQGSGGSLVESVVGGLGVLILLGIGGATELISAGRRRTWVLGAGS